MQDFSVLDSVGLKLGLFILDEGWRFTYVSATAAENWQRERAALLGQVFWDVFPGAADTPAGRNIRLAGITRQATDFEAVDPITGRWHRFEVRSAKEGMTVTLQEVQIEQEATRHPQVPGDHFPGVVARLDRQLRHIYVSPALSELTGKPVAKILGRTLDGIGYPRRVVDEWKIACRHVFATGEKYEFCCRGPGQADEVYLWHQLVPEFGGNGQVASILMISCDITAHKEAEYELRRRKQELAAIVDHSPDIIVRLDRNLRYIFVSPSVERVTGMKPEALLGKTSAQLGLPDDEWLVWQENFRQVFATGQAAVHTVAHRTPQGMLYLQASITPEFAADGQVATVLAIVRDITEQRCYEDEMVRRDRLNIIAEMAAGVAHEIRNPMTVIKGYTQFISKKMPPEYREQFDSVLAELRRIEVILGDFLSLARNKPLEPVLVNLNSVVAEVYPLVSTEAVKRGINIELKLNSRLPELEMDPGEIKQVIINLARNAMEAMVRRGTLSVATDVQAGKVVLTVADTGPGIPKEIRRKVFDPFFSTKDDGTGLGLAVCSSIMRRHGGTIWLDQGGKRGTTVSCCFGACV